MATEQHAPQLRYPADRATFLRQFRNYVTGSTVLNALCADGRRRTATIISEADTFFSLPARMVVWRQGRRYTVAGWAQTVEQSADDMRLRRADWEFHAYTSHKNAAALDPSGVAGIRCVCGRLATYATERCLYGDCCANLAAKHGGRTIARV